MMKKRSHGRTAYIEKCYTSCLSGLVRNFNSRVSRNSQKLLSDTRHCGHRYFGTSNSRTKLDLPSYTKMVHEDTDDDNGKEAKLDTLDMASIRTLMEEEMSITLNPKVFNGELDRVQSDLELDIYLKRNHHKKSKKHKVETCPQVNELKDSSDFDSSLSNSANQTASPSLNFDLAAHMVEFYCENYRYQEKQAGSNIEPCSAVEDSDHLNEPDSFCSQKHLSLEKALDDIADIFLCQKFIDPNLTTNEHAQSKEFKDALEKLNSNKELFFKLIQDQKSPLLKHVEELHGVSSPENVGRLAAHEEPVTRSPSQKQNWNSLFSRKKYKWKERWPSKGSHSSPATSKVVVLRPSPEVNQNASITESPSSSAQLPQGVKHHKHMERFFSSFSFQKLKKRLRRFIGESRKSKHAMSFDGNGILYGSRHSVDSDTNENNGSASKIPYDTEYKFQPLPIIRKKDEQSKQKELGLSNSGESFRYEEAKKHLAEMLAALDETATLPKKEVSEQLQKPLPSPEYESELPHQEMSFSESQEFNQENSMGDSETCSAGNAYETQVMDSTLVCTGGDLLNSKGTSEIFEISDIICTEEHRSGMLTESNGNEPNFESEKCKGEGSCEIFELGASDDKLEIPVPSASISSFLHVRELENLEEILENSERTGPMSVLEAAIPEESLSPGSTTVDNRVDFHQQPQKVNSEEHGNSAVVLISSCSEGDPKNCLGDKKVILGFVKTLLEASGLSCNETSERWHLSDQLVDPLLFEKLANSSGLLSDDPNLLFDYINEELTDTRERLFGCTPWVSIIKTDIQLILTRSLIGEVCKSIDRHFPEKQFPYIPDELESDIWMDLQLETDDVVMEMTDDILEEIMDRIVCELRILRSHSLVD